MKTSNPKSEKILTFTLWVITLIMIVGLVFLTSCAPQRPFYSVEVRDEYGQKSYYDFSHFQTIHFKGQLLVIDDKGDTVSVKFNDRKEVLYEHEQEQEK